jgi:hypothetical protein
VCVGARGVLFAQRSRRQGNSQRRRADAIAQQSVSNVISKKMCTLEIELEITTALPDKAYRPIQPSISKSPDIFASGGTATFRTARAFDGPSLRRYACWYLLNDLARTTHAAERYEFCGCQKHRGQLWGQLSNTPQATRLHYVPHMELFHSGPGTRQRKRSFSPPQHRRATAASTTRSHRDAPASSPVSTTGAFSLSAPSARGRAQFVSSRTKSRNTRTFADTRFDAW